MKGGVVPGVAGSHAAFAVGALGVDFLELGVNANWFPAEAEGDVDGVHAEVAHDADFAAGFDLAFPVDGFGGVEVAGVVKAGADFDDAPEFAGGDGLHDALGAGEEWKFGAATDEAAGGFRGGGNFFGGGQIDAEGFFGEEIFAGGENVEVHLLVEIVGDGDVNDVNFRRAEEFGVVFGEELDGGDLFEPLEEFILEIANGDEFGADGEVVEDKPAGESAGGFAAHEASSDNSDAHCIL